MRHSFSAFSLSLVVAAGVVAPSFVLAAEEAKGGVPQLDTTFFPAQLFWLVLSFGALYLLMAYVALPGVAKTQGKRQQTIAADLATASADNEAARTMVMQYERALTEARAKAQATVNQIIAQASKESAARQEAQQQELNKRLHAAETAIRSTRDAALDEVKASATELAHGIIEKVTGLKVKL